MATKDKIKENPKPVEPRKDSDVHAEAAVARHHSEHGAKHK